MKIVSVNYNYSPDFTSPESWIKRTIGYTGVLEALAKKNEVVCLKQIGWHGEVTHNGVNHCFTNLGANKALFILRLNHFIKSLKPDVILLHGLHQSFAFIHLQALLPKRVKIIAQHHAEKPSKTIKRHAQKLADKWIDAYLFASKGIAAEWLNDKIISSEGKVHEVMEVSSLFHQMEKSEAQKKTKVSSAPMFLWVGRLNENKDPLNVIRGFLKFAEEQPTAKLYMIYQTEELMPQINALLNNHPNKDSVILVGKIANADLQYWYNSADFLISGSYYEGSGTAVCEALSCGIIPIVTDIPSFRMITNDGDCGILYQAGNENTLIGALRKTQTLNIDAYRKKCLDWFGKKLSFAAIANDIEAVANSIVK